MYASSVKKYILTLIAIFCIGSIFLIGMSLYRGGWGAIQHNLLLISRGSIGNMSSLKESRDTKELYGDILYTHSNFTGALLSYEEAFLLSPTTRLGEKIRLLRENTEKKPTKTTSGESIIEEAKTRIEEDSKRRDEYLSDGKEFRDTRAVFDASLSENIDW